MSVRDRIIKILEEHFHPFYLNVHDFSESHAGHAGYRDGGETHFSISIVSEKFEEMPQVARHRLIYSLLGDELQVGEGKGIHALKLKTFTVDEARKRNIGFE